MSFDEFKVSGPSTGPMNVNAAAFSFKTGADVKEFTPASSSFTPMLNTNTPSFVPSGVKVVEPPPKQKEKGILAIEKLVADSEAAEKKAKENETEKKDEEAEGEEPKEPVDLVKVLSLVFEGIKKEKADSDNKSERISE